MSYRELDSGRYAELRSAIIDKKDNSKRKELLDVVRNSKNFQDWIRGELGHVVSGTKDLDLYPEKLTENEFKDTPKDVERIAFETWKRLTPRTASSCSFWATVTLNHIAKGIITSSYLATPRTPSATGLSRIEEALKQDDDEVIKDVARTILRRFSGLPEARGGLRTIAANCVFGRTWWRGYIISEVLKLTGGNREAITNTLRSSQEYWEKLMTLLSASNSVFGDQDIRSTFIWALSQYVDDKRYIRLFHSRGLIDDCVNLLGVYSAIQELGVFSKDDLLEFMSTQIIDVVTEASSDVGTGRT